MKVLDFGLSCFRKTLAQTYDRVGTPSYLAPELLLLEDDEPMTKKTDVYAYGVLLWVTSAQHKLTKANI